MHPLPFIDALMLYAKYLFGMYPNLSLRRAYKTECPNCDSYKSSDSPVLLASGIQVVECVKCHAVWRRGKERFQLARI